MPVFYNFPWYPTIYKHETTPQSGVSDVLTEGQVSNTSNYSTAYFNDISDYTYLFIKFYYTYEGTLRTFYSGLYVKDIPADSYYQFTITTESPTNTLTVRITKTSIALTHYNGAFRNIYCDIKGIKDQIW